MRLSGARLALAAAALAVACGGGGAAGGRPAATGEELVAPWVIVRFGEAPLLAGSDYEPAGPDVLLGTAPDRVIEVSLSAGKVSQVSIEWRAAAADRAEADLRARLPAPRACAGAHREIADYRPILWRLADGTAVSGLRKGKLYRLTVSRPGSAVFDEMYAACADE